MTLNCVNNSPTYDNLPAHRLEYIALRIEMFIHLFGIRNIEWPLDCTKLLQKMKETQIIPFHYGFFRLSDKYEAITDYRSEHNVYLMQINRSRVHYPFETSADRRLNFTLAHEIGHIMLDHLKVPRDLKTLADITREEHEANEFAGRLLMPKRLLFNCNFISTKAVAEYFNVSVSALITRINKLQRFDLLNSRKGNVCNVCGNSDIHYISKYCYICGNTLKNNINGIERIYYSDGISLNKYREACSCPVCSDDSDYGFTGKCARCDTSLINYCSKGLYANDGVCSYQNPGNARYCEICGSETYFYSIGILKPWQEARNDLLPEIVDGSD